MDRVAFYLSRGQTQGATQILDDTLAGSGCIYVTSGAGAYSTQRYALKVARLWARSVYNAAASSAPLGSHIVIGTGVAKAEDGGAAVAQVFSSAEGPWVSAGVALYCPDQTA